MTKDEIEGIERALKYTDAVDVAMAKMLRKGSTFINARDIAAIEDFGKNIEYYLATNIQLSYRVRRYYKDHKLTMKNAEEWDILHDEIKNVTTEMLEEANVSHRQYEQMKMMMKIDKNLLN